jgi:hypothetical protein
VLFPGGLYGTAPAPVATTTSAALKAFQNVRFSETYLYGLDEGNLDINDLYLTTTLAFPNFLWSGQPWFVSPGFGLHLWSDPMNMDVVPTAHAALPSRVYSAFLDIGWKSDPAKAFGVELSGRLGLYTDFEESVESDAFRPMGIALLRYNLTPTLALRAGVDYINRADIKLLPAGGLLWTPNPKTRWDIYFPKPKLASYLTTLGNRELWWYIGGEYGGGAWVVTLDDSDPTVAGLQPGRTLMDINDYRVFVGMELNNPAAAGVGTKGLFLEVGYVFEREVLLLSFPDYGFTPGETFMLRGGITF